jgi:hypothetical protein
LGWKRVQPTKFRKKVPFACRISACKWLCGRFQGGRRKSILAWPKVKKVGGVHDVAGKIFHGGQRWWRHQRWEKKREKVRPAEGEGNFGKKDDFLPKFHIDFFLFRK